MQIAKCQHNTIAGGFVGYHDLSYLVLDDKVHKQGRARPLWIVMSPGFSSSQSNNALYVLKYEYSWTLFVNIVKNVEEDGATAFLIIKALLFTCRTEGLTGETCDINIHGRGCGVIP